jgi:hypothetical protein
MPVTAVASPGIPLAQPVQPSSSMTQAGGDFKSLVAALKSGDLATAQQALAALQGDVRTARAHHGHHHHHRASASQQPAAALTPPASSASSAVNILA